MKAFDVVRRAREEGRDFLTEAEATQVLHEYGVPVVRESVCSTPEEAVRAAASYGYPVVLKGLGARLTHKTERGLVRLGLSSENDVSSAARDIIAGGRDVEGLLVQPMLTGRREFVAGMVSDPQFGPMVMFGLGGVFTEALMDAVFRIAPLSRMDAEEMIDGLHSSRLLQPFRGEMAADREQLVRTLLGVSRLAMDLTEVTEVDVNPLLVSTDGTVTAVDALIALGERPLVRSSRPRVPPADLFRLFSPRSVVFVGASDVYGKWGTRALSNVLAGGYQGDVHLVNRRGGQIAGRTVHRSVSEIPGGADLAVVSVPAETITDLLPECAAKGIRYIVVISSGFAETGADGSAAQERLVAAARSVGITLIGPNTMGISSPHAHFYSTGLLARPEPGSITFLSQSGNLGGQLLTFAETEGIGIRAFAGTGNEAMVTMEDLLDACAVDAETKTVILYVESVKDGRRFFETARALSRQKPIVILKSGATEAGSHAAASHTGAIASDARSFGAMCQQAGMLAVEQTTDLVDLAAAFSYLPLPRGRRVAIMSAGGGTAVVATDTCVRAGLELPRLTPEVLAEIDPLLPPFWSRANPLDLVGEMDPTKPPRIMETLAAWDGCDAILHLGFVGRRPFVEMAVASMHQAGFFPTESVGHRILAECDEAERSIRAHSVRLMERYQKPIIGIFQEIHGGRIVEAVPDNRYGSVCYLNIRRAVSVLAAMVAYREWLERQGEEP